MSKIFSKVVLAAVVILLVTGILSCENFLSGSNLQNEVSEYITDVNAKEVQLVFNEGSTGPIKAPKYVLKVGRTMEFTYNIELEYQFESWQITEENEVVDDLVEINKKEAENTYSIKILRTPKIITDSNGKGHIAKIIIVPVCKVRPLSVTKTPLNEPNGISRDRAIFIEFSKEINEKSFLFESEEIPSDAEIIGDEETGIYAYRRNGETYFKNIEIINSMNESLAEHYKAPRIEGKTLTIEVDKSNPIIIDSGSYEMIDVTVKKEVTDKEGVCLPTDINWHYKIIEATDEKATILTAAGEIEGVVTGTIPVEQKTRECNINQKISLEFTENAGYQFYKWDYDKTIVSVENPYSMSTTAVVLNTTKDSVSGEDHVSVITALAEPKLQVVSVEPSDGTPVSKNSSIKIKFSENLPADAEAKEIINGIMISIGSVSVKDCFAEPEIINDTILFAANNNLISVDAGETKTVTVTIPKELYYALEDGTKITMNGYGENHKYIIDDSTVEKTEISFSAPKESGKIFVDGKDISEETGFIKFSSDQEIALSFELSNGYQFNTWKVFSGGNEVPEDKIKVSNPKDRETKLKIKTLLNGVTVVANTSSVLTATAADVEGKTVPKDTDIVITFNKEIAQENDLSKIKITADGAKADSYYSERIVNGKTLTIKNKKRFDISKGSTKDISVLIPKDFYYLNDGNKVTLEADREINFTIDYTTKEKVTVYFNIVNGENGNPIPLAGSLNVESMEEMYLDEEKQILLTLNDGYYFQGFTYLDINGFALTKDILSVESKNEFEKVLRFNNPTAKCNVNVVCYKRPSVAQKSPYSSNGLEVFKNNKTIEIELNHRVEDACKDMIELSYTGGTIDQKEYYNAEIDGTGTKIRLVQKKGKLLEIRNTSETVTVRIPKEIYYLAADGKTHIEEGTKDIIWSYKINNETVDTTSIEFESGNGKIKADGKVMSVPQTYSENKIINLEYIPEVNYAFEKWQVSGIPEGYECKTDEGKFTVEYVNEDDTTETYLEIDNLNSEKTELKIYTAISGTITITGSQYQIPTASFEPEKKDEGKEFDTEIKINFNKEMNKDTISLTELDVNSNVKVKGTVSVTIDEEHVENCFTAEWMGTTLKLKPKPELSKFVPEEKTKREVRVTVDASKVKDKDGYLYGGTENFTYIINGKSKVSTNIQFLFDNATLLINGQNILSTSSKEFSYSISRSNKIELKNNSGMEFKEWSLTIPDSTEYICTYNEDEIIVEKNDVTYFVLQDRFSEITEFVIYNQIDKDIILSCENLLQPVVSKSYAGSNSDNPVYTPSGYACDSVVTFEFNKNMDTSSIKLTRVYNTSSGVVNTPGTIDIVSLNNPNEHYEEYFTVELRNNILQIIPSAVVNAATNTNQYKRDKLKIKTLVPEKESLYEFKIIFNANVKKDNYGNIINNLYIKDEEGLSLNLKTDNWIYKINGNQEEEKPKINSLKLYSKKFDLENNTSGGYEEVQVYTPSYYEMKQDQAKAIHVGKSMKISVDVSDNSSGISAIKCIERLEKSITNTTITNQSYEHGLIYPANKVNRITNDFYFDFKLDKDGLVCLEFCIEDLAGNVSTEKRYVLKDTTVDETILIPANISEDSERMWNGHSWVTLNATTSGSTYNVSEVKKTDNKVDSGYKFAYYELRKPEYLTGTEDVYVYTDNNNYSVLTHEKFIMFDDTNIVLDLSFIKDVYYKISSTKIFTSDHRLNVFYKYNKSDEYPEEPNAIIENRTEELYENITYNSLNKTVEKHYYKIPHNPSSKETYIKIECIDDVGNKASIERIVPGQLNITSFKIDSYGTAKNLNARYERLDTYKAIAEEAGAKFDILFYYTGPDANPNPEAATSNYTISSSTTYGISKPRRSDGYIQNPFIDNRLILFTDNNFPDAVYMPNGTYNLNFVPYFEYPDGTKYYGKPSQYSYDWNSSSPKSTNEILDTSTDFPGSFEVEVLPAVPSKGTRTIKVTLPSKSESFWNYLSSFTYGIKYYAHQNDSINSNSVLNNNGQNYLPFTSNLAGTAAITEYFELPSGYKYDICLYQKSKTSTTYLYLSKNTYVLNIDLTEDNIPPTVECFVPDYVYRYVNYPGFIRLSNFSNYYKLIPEDSGYGLFNYYYPEDFEDEGQKGDLSDIVFDYYILKKENETWATPQISLEWLDEQEEEGNIRRAPGCFNLKYDSVNDKYIPGAFGEVYADINTTGLAEGYYTFVMRLKDNRMNPDGEFYYDDELSHQPNESLLVFPISTKIVNKKSSLKYDGTKFILNNQNSNYYNNEYYTTVEKIVHRSGSYCSWQAIKTLGMDNRELYDSEYSDSPFLRIHTNDSSVGDSYLFSYICPAYVKYKYSNPEFELYSKAIIKTNQGYQIFTDGPVLIQQVISKENLSEICPSGVDEGLYWLSKGTSKGVMDYTYGEMRVLLYNDDVTAWKSASYTYTGEKDHLYANYYNVTVFVFADGTTLIGDVTYR